MRLVQAAKEAWDRFEALVGLIAAFMLAFGPVTLLGGVALFAFLVGEWQVAKFTFLGFAITCPMAVWLARMSEPCVTEFWQFSGYPDRRPFALVLASKLPALPLVVRVPLAIWWFAHFVAGTLLIEFSDWLVQESIFGLLPTDGIPSIVVGYLFHFATNIFLILAATALIGSDKVTRRVWRKRFVYDFVFTLPLFLRLFF